MPRWHATFHRMRGMHKQRPWMSWTEFHERLKSLGLAITRYQLSKVLKADPPVSKRGWNEERHVVLVAEYARGEGWYE